MADIWQPFWSISGNFSFCHRAAFDFSCFKHPICEVSYFQHKNYSGYTLFHDTVLSNIRNKFAVHDCCTLESLLNVHGRLTFSEKRKGVFLIFQGVLLKKLTFGQPVFLLKTVFIKSPGWILMICSIRLFHGIAVEWSSQIFLAKISDGSQGQVVKFAPLSSRYYYQEEYQRGLEDIQYSSIWTTGLNREKTSFKWTSVSNVGCVGRDFMGPTCQ